MSRATDLLHDRLTVVRYRGDEADARCPAHDDHSASLTFGPGRHGGAVVKCHAGCDTKEVLATVGLSYTDISPQPHLVASYVYRDEDGTPLWTTERWEPKTFRQRGLPAPAQRRLYHSEWLNSARARDVTVYVVEGEKDADTLAGQGLMAVCGVNGADSWLEHYADQLAGLNVVVVADNDEPGKAHARTVASSLDGKAREVALTVPSYGKDASDMIEAGYSVETLVPLSAHPTLGVLRADQVRERQVSWLWPGYLPKGKLVMIDGDPGDGKSVMTCDLAARFTTGAMLPDGQRPLGGPTDVAMISAEDDPEDTIKPRLRVAGADQRRVHLITAGTIPGLPFSLGRDLPALEAFVQEMGVGLVVVDPLMAFMPAEVDSYKDADVRRVLHPVTDMAMRTGCCVLVVRHLTKGRTKAISAGGGAMGFIGAARVGFLVGPHPEDDRKRVLAGVKINVGPMPSSLGYLLASSDPTDTYAPPLVKWDTVPLKLTAQELLDNPVEDREAAAEAKQWLHDHLCAHHSGLSWAEITRAGKKEGYAEHTLRNVRSTIAEQIQNPKNLDGTERRGYFWFARKVGPRHLAVVPDPASDLEISGGQPAEPDDKPDTPTERPVMAPHFAAAEPESSACGVCGSEPALLFTNNSERVRRCRAHNPMTYGG